MSGVFKPLVSSCQYFQDLISLHSPICLLTRGQLIKHAGADMIFVLLVTHKFRIFLSSTIAME